MRYFENIPSALVRLAKNLLVCGILVVACDAAMADEEKVVTVEINKGTMVKLSRPASSVVIADPATADIQVVSPKMVLVRGKKVGETSLFAMDAQDEPILSAVVNVTHNLSNLERTIKRVVPDADVGFKTVDGGLVMDGFTGTTDESENIRNIASTFMGSGEKMVDMIKTNGSDQVMLKVKIVEMARSDLKTLGVNLQNIATHGNFSMQLLQGNDITFNGSAAAANFQTFGNVLNRGGGADENLFLRYKGYAGLIDALESQGLATVLAEPSLTTTSGHAASFLAGGQYPIPVAGQNGTVTVQYQSFGVSLNFTPVVINKNHISLTVAPEVSTLDFSNPIKVSGFVYPILDDRKASAVVELGSGDSFMLAGLIKKDTSNDISKFPGLGDLPVLGALFRSTQFQNNQTELVILVTPYIVHPVVDQKLQTPTDGYVPPSDFQLLMNGELYTQQPMSQDNKQTPPSPKLNGEGGFIME